MTAVIRLVTYTDLVEENTNARQMSVSAQLEAELADGRSVVLLYDRGWGATLGGVGPDEPVDIRAWVSVEEIETDARMVVGPDEPLEGRTYEETEASYWASLAKDLLRQGVEVDARELARLPHDVVLSERLRAWVTGEA
ncbi:hypothetical protein [Streptomyces sp. URMC 123]|uniref:hypothetical protein n=1 Tax=Streptomyces sp. URMC 123 TaxID=3423403 RepID=UPI003F19C265